MSRPLEARIEVTATGRFQVELPVARGSKKRRRRTFDTHAEAVAWRAAGLLALAAGQPLPEPRGSSDADGGSGAASTGTRLLPVAEEWIREYYAEDNNGDLDREEDVTRYARIIDEFMRSRDVFLETFTREHERAMYRSLIKRPASEVGRTVELDGSVADTLVTRAQAREVLAERGLPVSDSTIKRAIRRRALQMVARDGATHLYRLGDLFDPTSGLTGSGTRGRYSRSSLKELRWVLNGVKEHAVSRGIGVPASLGRVKPPKQKVSKPKVRGLTLAETGRIARRLHVVHQLVLFLTRLLGMRISEAYGLLVEDVVDPGPGHMGLLLVRSQGGRKFKRRGPDGERLARDHLDEVKTESSRRVIVVPAQLLDVIRLVIDIFHTHDGVVRTEDRLVPGLKRADAGGQSSFRTALANAATEEGLNMVVDERRVLGAGGDRVLLTPKHMRKSFATALQAANEAVENIRRVMGHLLGDEVIHTSYLVENLDLGPQRSVAEKSATEIRDAFPDGLIIPTGRRCTTGNQPALRTRAAEIDSRLAAAGWLIDNLPEGEWLTVADAAGIRGVTRAHVLTDIEAGRVAAVKVPRTDQTGWRYLVDIGELLDLRDQMNRGSELGHLADELGVPYDRLRLYISRHPDLQLEPGTGRDQRVPKEVAAHVRTYFEAQAALAARAAPLPRVAQELGLTVAAIDTLIRHRRLVEGDRFHGGIRSITLASLAEFRSTPGSRRR